MRTTRRIALVAVRSFRQYPDEQCGAVRFAGGPFFTQFAGSCSATGTPSGRVFADRQGWRGRTLPPVVREFERTLQGGIVWRQRRKKKETSRDEVYEFLMQIGTASKLPKPWDNLAGDGSLFDLRLANGKLANCLRERFEDAILKTAGVVNVDSEGQVALAPTLAQNRSCILASDHVEGSRWSI